VAHHRRRRARRPALTAPARRVQAAAVLRIVLLIVTVAFTAFIGVATVLDMIDNGVSWLDILALLIVLLFTTGICGALLESIRRG
jgi:hypothetical protein